MIDIHCHLLPALDDGPRDARACVALASRLFEEGVTAVVATPHRLNGMFPRSTAERAAVAAVVARDAIAAAGIALRVEVGAEVVFGADVVGAVLADPSLRMGGGRYVLLEIPPFGLSYKDAIADVTFRLRTEGVTPILAHVERYDEFSEDPDVLADLRERGALTQVTGPALVGHYGSDWEKASRTFLKRGLVDLLASDAHDAERRPPRWRDAMKEVERLAGAAAARALGHDGPARVLDGTPWPTA